MIGRAALGNPWMIYRTKHYLETGELVEEPTVREKMDTAKIHLDRLINLKGEKLACREFRQHAAYYLKGVPRASRTKVAINKAETKEEMIQIIDDFVCEVEAR